MIKGLLALLGIAATTGIVIATTKKKDKKYTISIESIDMLNESLKYDVLENGKRILTKNYKVSSGTVGLTHPNYNYELAFGTKFKEFNIGPNQWQSQKITTIALVNENLLVFVITINWKTKVKTIYDKVKNTVIEKSFFEY